MWSLKWNKLVSFTCLEGHTLYGNAASKEWCQSSQADENKKIPFIPLQESQKKLTEQSYQIIRWGNLYRQMELKYEQEGEKLQEYPKDKNGMELVKMCYVDHLFYNNCNSSHNTFLPFM